MCSSYVGFWRYSGQPKEGMFIETWLVMQHSVTFEYTDSLIFCAFNTSAAIFKRAGPEQVTADERQRAKTVCLGKNVKVKADSVFTFCFPKINNRVLISAHRRYIRYGSCVYGSKTRHRGGCRTSNHNGILPAVSKCTDMDGENQGVSILFSSYLQLL